MKTKINFITILIALLCSIGKAHASTINDLPEVILTCNEIENGGILHDGAKQLILSQDQFYQTYFTVIQKDQFSGDKVVINNLFLNQKSCEGFVPCKAFKSQDGTTKVLINSLIKNKEFEIIFNSKTIGLVSFICHK